MKIVRVEDVTQMMCLDTDQVHNLAKGCIDLLLRYINTLGASKSEPTNCSYLIDCINGKHLIDEGRLL